MLSLAVSVIVALVVIGVLLWAINQFLGRYMQPQILQLLNVAVVVIVVICLFFTSSPRSACCRWRPRLCRRSDDWRGGRCWW